MQRVYPSLTPKMVMLLTEDGIYKREGDTWYLLQGCAAQVDDESCAAPLSGVDRPGEAEAEGMMTRPRDGAPGTVPDDSPEDEVSSVAS